MGIMDKVKAQAGQLADTAKQAQQAGQAKVAEIQAKRRADALLAELGGIVYAERAGRPVPDAEVRTAQVVARLQAHEAEHGPLPEPGTTADQAAG
jgi:hypothetical protein